MHKELTGISYKKEAKDFNRYTTGRDSNCQYTHKKVLYCIGNNQGVTREILNTNHNCMLGK